MKLNSGLVVVGFLLLAGDLRAQTDDLLGEEPKVQVPTGVTGISNAPAQAESVQRDGQWRAPVEKGMISENGKVAVTATGGYQFNNYTLRGTGLNSTVPVKGGLMLGGSVKYRSMNGLYAFSGSYNTSKIKNDALPGVTPASIDSTRKILKTKAHLYPFRQGEGLGLSAGYAWVSRTSTLTSPNAVISSYDSSGPVVGAEYAVAMTRTVGFESGLDFYFPSYYQERDSNTGYRNTAYSVDLAAGFFYSVSPQVAVGVKPYFRMESTSYAGTGNRGVTDGSEKDWTYGVPVALRVLF